MYQMSSRRVVLNVAIFALLCFCAHRANADLTIVAQIDVQKSRPNPANFTGPIFPVTVTTYIQGSKARVEDSEGRLYIVDLNSETLYQIDNKTNTYRTGSLNDIDDYKKGFRKKLQRFVRTSSAVNSSAKSETQAMDGFNATRFSFAGVAHVSMAAGGDNPDLVDQSQFTHTNFDDPFTKVTVSYSFPVSNLLGTVWATDDRSFAKDSRSAATLIASQMLWNGGPLSRDFTKQVKTLQGLPLHSEMTVTETYAGTTAMAPVSTDTVTTTFDAKSISVSAISPSLFEIPAGYARDSAPINADEGIL